jgi:hypothetical protein
VFDLPAAQTGWMQTSGIPGVAPQKKWNASRAKFERQPGDDWKRALRVPVAYTPEARAIWDQASAAAWMCFCDLIAEGDRTRQPTESAAGVVHWPSAGEGRQRSHANGIASSTSASPPCGAGPVGSGTACPPVTAAAPLPPDGRKLVMALQTRRPTHLRTAVLWHLHQAGTVDEARSAAA